MNHPARRNRYTRGGGVAGEMKDPTVGADLERVMDQAVGISLGQEPPAAVDARLRALAAAQGTRWDADSSEVSPVVSALQAMPVRPAHPHPHPVTLGSAAAAAAPHDDSVAHRCVRISA